MKTRMTALLIMLAAMVILSACSAGTHNDLVVSENSDTTSSFSESKSAENSSNPESTSASVMVGGTAEVHSDAEESDTSIQASAASESVSSSSTQGQAQSKPSSTTQPQAETFPEQKPQPAQEPTHEPVKPQPTEKPTPKPTEEPTHEPTPEPTQQPSFDIGYWVSYAQNYAQNKGLNIDSSATECWDNPISAGANCTSTESSIISRINRYANDEDITDVWIWAESTGDGNYDLYIGYA